MNKNQLLLGDEAIALSKAAEDAGVDALLVVSPYYNKATPDGLLTHYAAIADAVHIPVIVYNVPSRTGVDIPVSVYQSLARIPNIAGVKEASGDITKIARIRAQCPEEFAVWSGNDDQAAAVKGETDESVLLCNVLDGVSHELATVAVEVVELGSRVAAVGQCSLLGSSGPCVTRSVVV